MSAIYRGSSWATVVALSMCVAACGGGSGGPSQAQAPAPVPAPVPSSGPAPTPASTQSLRFGGFSSSDAPPVLSDTSRVLAVTAMAYDAAHDQLITTVADASGPTLQGLDPVTLATRWTLPAPALASRISISDDGSTAYFALPLLGTVWQVDLANRAAVRSIQVGDMSRHEGPLSLSTRPGHPGTIAVSVGLMYLPLQNFVRTSVFDDGVMRPKSTGADESYLTPDTLTEIAFTDADHVVGYDTQSTGCGLTRMTLQPDGLQPIVRAYPFGIFAECFGEGLAFTAGRLFTSSGQEVDANTLAHLRVWPGVGAPGSGFLDTNTGTWVRISSSTYTGQDTVPIDGRVFPTTRVSVEEIEPQRLTLRRSVLTQEPFELQGLPDTNGMATSGGRIAFTVFDPTTGNTAVHSSDLSSVQPFGHASFAVSTASGPGATGLSLPIPGVAMASDPLRHRLVVALDGGIGPDGNSLAVVNPDTGAVEKIIPLPDRPVDLKVSSTGSIAYVSHINAIASLDRVDLVSGQVTSLPVRADAFAIKEDDPQSVVVLDFYANHTLTALHDMTTVGTPFDWQAAGLVLQDSLWPHGPNELLAVGVDSTGTGTGNGIIRFSWSQDGGIAYGSMSSLGVALPSQAQEVAFDKIWTAVGVTNLSTTVPSPFPGLADYTAAVTPTSATSAILFRDIDTRSLSWLQADSLSGNWVSTFALPVDDTAWTGGLGIYSQHVIALGQDQVALRVVWSGEPRTSSEPSHIYIVKRTP